MNARVIGGVPSDYLKGLEDALSPALRPILWRVLGLGLGLSALLVWAAFGGATYLPPTGWSWLDAALRWLAAILAGTALAFAFPILLTTLQSLFLDDAAARAGRRAFPGESVGRDMGLAEGLLAGLRFLGLVLFVNLMSLPLHIAGLALPILNVLVFWGVNGYLVGREYFEQVALRHGGRNEVLALRRRFVFTIFAAGLIGTALMVVPVINLIAPLVTVAAMVRLEHRLRTHGGRDITRPAPTGRR